MESYEGRAYKERCFREKPPLGYISGTDESVVVVIEQTIDS